ncbi:MAG: PTS sugar transporter subunit IIB, partial [Gemmatimonadota bacterium]|nr:PTS sugar transporter subunit IIB [Gemmatimonadota bacterium]
ESASRHLENFLTDSRTGIVLVGDIGTMQRLVTANPAIRSINIGGVHHAPGRTAKLRYVFLTPDEEQGLRAIQASGVDVSAQDVPGSRAIPLKELLAVPLDS